MYIMFPYQRINEKIDSVCNQNNNKQEYCPHYKYGELDIYNTHTNHNVLSIVAKRRDYFQF